MRRRQAPQSSLILGLALLAACGGPPPTTPTATPPTATSAPAIAPPTYLPVIGAPSATAAAVVLDLPALGGTRPAWVRAKGAPSRAALGDLFDQNTAVTFAPAPDGHERAARIELLLGHSTGADRAGVPVAQARAMAALLHPPDGRAIRTYASQDGHTVEVFRSELLADAFGGATRPPPAAGTPLGDDPAGTYIQVAERGSPTTNRVVLAVGNNP